MQSRMAGVTGQTSAAGKGGEVVVVDDDHVFRGSISLALRSGGWSTVVMSTAEAMDVALPEIPSAVVLEPCPHGSLNLRLLSNVVSNWGARRVFVVTYYPSLALGMTCVRAGAQDCFAKPIHPEHLLQILNGGLPCYDQVRESDAISLARVQHEFIAQTLRYANWNISVAARTMGIQRSTLQRKLRKIPPGGPRPVVRVSAAAPPRR